MTARTDWTEAPCAEDEHRAPFLAALDVGPDGLLNEDGEVEPLDPEEHEGIVMALSDALAVCKRCPIRAECLEAALTNGEEYGVWGGTLPEERADVAVLAKRLAREAFRE